MEYRNKITGAVISVNSELRGNWEPVVKKPAAKPKEAPKKKGTTKK